MSGLGPLGAVAGGFTQGLNDAENNALKKLQIQAAKDSLAGDASAGNIVSQMYSGPNQQQPAPQQGGLGGILGKLGSFLQGGGAQPTVAQPQAPQQQPMQGPPQGGQPMPQQGMPQQQPQQAPQPQQPPLDPSRMTLEQIVKAARRVNPDMPPQQLMTAIQKLTPVMNAQALQEYHAVQQQLAGKRLDIQQDQGNKRIAVQQQRADTQQDQGQQRLDQGAQRLSQQGEQFQTRLAKHEQQLASAKDAADKRAINLEARAAVTAHLSAMRLKIEADKTLDEDERAARMKEASAEADDARKRLDVALKAQSDAAPSEWKPTGASRGADGGKTSMRAGDAPATQGRTPGTTMTGPDGKQYKFRGGDWDARESWEPVGG